MNKDPRYVVIYEREDRKSHVKELHECNSIKEAREHAIDMLVKRPYRSVMITRMSIFQGKPDGWEAYERCTMVGDEVEFKRIDKYGRVRSSV